MVGILTTTENISTIQPPPTPNTLSVIATGTPPRPTPPELLPPTTTSSTTQTPSGTSTPPKITKPATTSPLSTLKTPTKELPAPPTQSDLEAASVSLRLALVNIVCTASAPYHSITGSGVIIDPRGIILTNAHIAQYYVLASDPKNQIDCVIRAGSPARTSYLAELLYISSEWITKNSTSLSTPHPTGTGEYDFALLAITESASRDPLASSFSFVPLSSKSVATGEPVVIASYAAQFLSYDQVYSGLYPTIVYGGIKDILTFASTTVDVFYLGGSAAAQEGSSGGGVIDAQNKLIGLITTSTIEGETSTRNLSAITGLYIKRDYAKETNSTLEILFSHTLEENIKDFAPKIPLLLKQIVGTSN
jgi:hypothetical protein